MNPVRLFAAITIALFIGGAAPAAPTPEVFLGRPLGARFTPHHRILDYFDALAAARPERISLVRFGETWEGRPLVAAVIASEANHARLDRIREASRRLADARATSRAEAERIAAEMPAIVWLAFGVHGDESSSAEAAMVVAGRLAADDEAADALLRDLVVVIDPLQNPDGRERYIQWFEGRVGRAADPDPEALEHYQPWPGGRYNHYLADMNRDWVWSTQRESRARVALYLDWNPQVFVDFHEMGYGSTYFFPPDADPINRNIDARTQWWLEEFGRANAEVFSSRGWPFFVGERFDLFYPGYGDSWPSLRGAIGMTYEMAGHGFAGRAIRREDGTVLTLAQRIEKHATAAIVTLETAASRRRELLMHVQEAAERQAGLPERTWLLPPGAPNLPAVLTMLDRQKIEMGVLSEPLRIAASRAEGAREAAVELPAGTVTVSTRQPFGALVRTLFERSPEIDPAFLEKQRERIHADEPDEFYDITAWSVPLAFNVPAWSTTQRVPEGKQRRYAHGARPAPPSAARFGWIADATDPAIHALIGELLRREINFSVISEELRHDSRAFARGSLLVQRHNNGDDVLESLTGAAAEAGAALHAVDHAWSGGLALGSGRVVHVRDPRIAIVGGDGTAPTSFGELWHAFDQVVRIPYTAIPLQRLGAADLARFRVLILPDGAGYGEVIEGNVAERLKSWVEQGNTLIAIRRAARALRTEKTAISSTKLWEPPKPAEDAPAETKRYHDYSVPGAAFRTTMNARSYLTFGVPESPAVLVRGTDVLLPVPYAIDNVISIAKEDALAAGFVWPESLERVRGSSWLVVERVGRGKVVTFADDPFFRSFWHGTLPLLLNAAVYSPSFE